MRILDFCFFATNSLIIGGTQTLRPFLLLPQFAHYHLMMRIASCPSHPCFLPILKLQHPHSVVPSFPKTLEADPKGQLLAFIRIVSECDDRYCRGHHSHYSLQIIPKFPVCCSMTTCRCRAPFLHPCLLVYAGRYASSIPIILPL